MKKRSLLTVSFICPILCTVQSVSGLFHPDVDDTFSLRYTITDNDTAVFEQSNDGGTTWDWNFGSFVRQ